MVDKLYLIVDITSTAFNYKDYKYVNVLGKIFNQIAISSTFWVDIFNAFCDYDLK